MLTKAEKTRNFIIEKAAPVFNKQGYADTSIHDITQTTGLTKGSIYGNFKDKEELAIEAFNFNIRKVMHPLANLINEQEDAEKKLKVIFSYYRTYYSFVIPFGGCPILNIGIDSSHQDTPLRIRVKQVVAKLIRNIEEIIEEGKKEGIFSLNINSSAFAKRIYSSIEGCIFTAMIQEDEEHIKDMMNFLDQLIDDQLLK